MIGRVRLTLLTLLTLLLSTGLWAWLILRGCFCLCITCTVDYAWHLYPLFNSLAGFVDIFSKSKDRIGAHTSKILKFLHRNRIPSNTIPFPVLDGYNGISAMRAAVLQDFLDHLLQKEKGSSIWSDCQHRGCRLWLQIGWIWRTLCVCNDRKH